MLSPSLRARFSPVCRRSPCPRAFPIGSVYRLRTCRRRGWLLVCRGIDDLRMTGRASRRRLRRPCAKCGHVPEDELACADRRGVKCVVCRCLVLRRLPPPMSRAFSALWYLRYLPQESPNRSVKLDRLDTVVAAGWASDKLRGDEWDSETKHSDLASSDLLSLRLSVRGWRANLP